MVATAWTIIDHRPSVDDDHALVEALRHGVDSSTAVRDLHLRKLAAWRSQRSGIGPRATGPLIPREYPPR